MVLSRLRSPGLTSTSLAQCLASIFTRSNEPVYADEALPHRHSRAAARSRPRPGGAGMRDVGGGTDALLGGAEEASIRPFADMLDPGRRRGASARRRFAALRLGYAG